MVSANKRTINEQRDKVIILVVGDLKIGDDAMEWTRTKGI